MGVRVMKKVRLLLLIVPVLLVGWLTYSLVYGPKRNSASNVHREEVGLSDEKYAGQPVSYWRERIRPNPVMSWDIDPNFPLYKNPDPQAIPILLELLRDDDCCIAALACLARLGPQAEPAAPALVEALGHPIASVRIDTARTLGAIGPKAREAVPALTAALKDPEPLVRVATAQALWRVSGSPDAAV